MSKIKKIQGREILDSRGNPTVETEVELESGVKALAAVPSGASTGTYEALELRDNDSERYGGLGVLKALKNIREEIAPKITGMDAEEQQKIDREMIRLDGTENKSRLGANAILGVSLAVCRAAAWEKNIPLYRRIASRFAFPVSRFNLPCPMFNVINGGKHSDSGLSIQEYKIIPSGIKSFREKLRAGSEIFQALKKIISAREQSVSVGDEGGFAPKLQSNAEPLEIINEAVEKAGYSAGKEIFTGVDSAANSFFDKSSGQYVFKSENVLLTREMLINTYNEWIAKYHLLSVEDGLNEDDWEGWKIMNEKIGKKTVLIGDDLLVTNVQRLKKAIAEKACNAVLIKLNQIGTLTETIECVKLAQKNEMKVIVSHRSGETTDDFISDLAVAVSADYLKAGSLSRGERVCKYNRLLRIEEELNQFDVQN